MGKNKRKDSFVFLSGGYILAGNPDMPSIAGCVIL